jgi:hypothetical protein
VPHVVLFSYLGVRCDVTICASQRNTPMHSCQWNLATANSLGYVVKGYVVKPLHASWNTWRGNKSWGTHDFPLTHMVLEVERAPRARDMIFGIENPGLSRNRACPLGCEALGTHDWQWRRYSISKGSHLHYRCLYLSHMMKMDLLNGIFFHEYTCIRSALNSFDTNDWHQPDPVRASFYSWVPQKSPYCKYIWI